MTTNPVPTIVLAICVDERFDPVASSVLAALEQAVTLTDSPVTIDGRPALQVQLATRRLEVLRLDTVLSHDYRRYAPQLNAAYADAEAIIVVNWHEGSRAPDNIFTIQTTGDMASGTFSPVDPAFTRALFLTVERERQRAGLDAFSTWMEATHWSGTQFGSKFDFQPGELVGALNVPVIDLEIGSAPAAWSDRRAARVLARALIALGDAPDRLIAPRDAIVSLLCVGGMHFEPAFTQLMLDHGESQQLALSHILPNHWLVAHDYDREERFGDLLACAQSIRGGIDAIAFHDNLKSSYKQPLKRLAAQLGVPALSHRKLRTADLRAAIRDAANALAAQPG
ncbi:D-aminoacyl-tRNA deacylase [Burkholderia sp. Ax-1719]|uniref:D-aminoacyl-tRNA deacylase n=1 Tax=Burkholderia sp. Ax-1719 TaxID=2608334 RepID=UPI00141E340E|nr:D-aminoacyl-tRNA deacylase [Burkholderia sp. Ax-1719]NIE65420.1 D-aminoacyl-tRNA deacylase [Burkholderia sp. Ax-1719]